MSAQIMVGGVGGEEEVNNNNTSFKIFYLLFGVL